MSITFKAPLVRTIPWPLVARVSKSALLKRLRRATGLRRPLLNEISNLMPRRWTASRSRAGLMRSSSRLVRSRETR